MKIRKKHMLHFSKRLIYGLLIIYKSSGTSRNSSEGIMKTQ